MGGMGSGRQDQGGKNTTNDYHHLDIRRLQRDDLLRTGLSYTLNWSRNNEKVASIQIQTQDDRLTLDYRYRKNGGDWKNQNYSVMLDSTECSYGGKRVWFKCPANGCGRRVALLYLGSSGIFACRHCYKLVYESQRESADDRSSRKADRIRDKLAWQRGILNPNGDKPKGMHWKTYDRLKAQHDAYVDVTLRGMAKRFGFLDKILGE
ncbi:hypothetical protein KEF85_10035 [Methylomonas paludis]|uniref:Uncharacterized protein n=1 Tax=Methylomonas paludis TaxID=1173101 RepID=A0A975MLS0_9GAMM|nr:hypothetical protein [Methylomonas paludis]QWF69714.1 hypothetical protein KEF85_10035 [Methylomonas paludis]